MISEEKIINLNCLSINQTKDFNASVDNIRNEFNNMLGSIISDTDTSIDFLLTSIMSREPEFSPLFERCCKLAYVRDQIQHGSIERIVLDDALLFRVIKESISNCEHKIEITCDQKISIKINHFLRPIRNFIRSASISFFMFIASKKVSKEDVKFDEIILISTHILKTYQLDDLDSGYIDRNFPDVMSFLNPNESKKLFFIPQFPGGPRPYNKIFKKIRESEQNFILKADYLKLVDYLYAFLYPLRISSIELKKIYFLDYEISSIIRSELWNFIFDYKTIESLLNIRVQKRLSEAGLKIRTFLDWYENQLSSRGLIYGFRKYFPESKILGYQGIIDSASYRINLHPTEYERKKNLIPDKIIVTGDALVNSVKEYDQNIDVITGPSFRYHYLWNKERNTDHKHLNILVSLPIFREQSENILNLINDLARSLREYNKIVFLIKPHPTQTSDKRLLGIIEKKSNIKVIGGEFYDFIEKSDLLIGSASTTCMESIALGIPVAIIGVKNKILQNPIPSSIPSNLWRICYTVEELEIFIKILVNKEGIEYSHQNDDIKSSYFIEPNRENVEQLFDLRN